MERNLGKWSGRGGALEEERGSGKGGVLEEERGSGKGRALEGKWKGPLVPFFGGQKEEK